MIDIETQTYHTMLSNCCVSERILKVWKRGSLLYERLWGSCERFFLSSSGDCVWDSQTLNK